MKKRLALVLALIVAFAFLALAALRTGPAPAIEIRPSLRALGRATPVAVEVREPSRGVSSVRVELLQGDLTVTLAEEPGRTLAGWRLWGDRDGVRTLGVTVGKEREPRLAEGPATIRVTAAGAGAWLRAAPVVVAEVELPVRLTAPRLEVVSTQTYVAQGGSEAVVYRVGPTAVRDGVRAGDRFFPGWPLPGGQPTDRFALFAVPYDLGDAGDVELVAADEVGNQRTARFVDRFFPQPPRADDIQLTDPFLEKVVTEIRAETPDLPDAGGLLESYLAINRDLRAANARELVALAAQTAPSFLWKAPFLALPGGQVMSSFADRRTYFYGGREVDRQDHLGFDLASVARADVPAANAGVVVLARYFGIYGNTVVVDHGYGLMSLYAHLSSIAVAPGDHVERGRVLGRSGATGLAGGDHLHFSFLLQGLPVRPVEWWDPHWIEDRLKRKLGAALPFSAP